ncbi:hypothetical protein [Kordia sp. SMS9]|uniref:hypothetical protein n=1 Tax=Kordia sp. SMS9 TaxID=2282170 RepID=UPI000E0D3235|nr:hypothetical protein [Kordia sp. SMS9]
MISIIGITAPYSHMFYDKKAPELIQLEKSYDDGIINKDEYSAQKAILKEKYSFVGFTNVRRFLYAIGLPVALFVSSLLILLSTFIKHRLIIYAIRCMSIPFVITGAYFITWTLWDRQDFPESIYYTTITLLSIVITAILYYIFKIISKDFNKLETLRQQLNPLKRNIDFVSDLADIIPETSETVSYKAMTSVTSEDLKENLGKIEETLND